VVAEITARKAAEVARAALEARLRVSQKMEAIGTLASGIAHDFNNILGAIYGYTELARYDASDNPAVLDSLDEVTKASERAATLIRQILTFSRQEEQQRQELQLTPLLLEALKLLRAVVPSCVVFQLALAPDARPVLANPTQIHQIMMNLGTNAAHAMRGQPGRVTVTLANCTVDAKLAAAIPELRPGPHVRLSVSDTGHGMEQATADRVFDPFFTTKSPTEGTGLGLSVVHGIMRSSKGAITVKSQLGQGTTFDLYFPALLGTLPAAVGVIPAVPRGHGERILFVDDEEALGNFVKRMLERLGYVVEVERRPQGALNAVQARPEAYALVITDLTMPELLGTELARQLHQLKPGLPILLTSGYAADLAAASLAAVGIVELLNKPFSFEALGQAVYRALQK
jgi:nitrogen-specific signal transduction histidine kinase